MMFDVYCRLYGQHIEKLNEILNCIYSRQIFPGKVEKTFENGIILYPLGDKINSPIKGFALIVSDTIQ